MGVKEDWKMMLLYAALIAAVAAVLLIAKAVGITGAWLYLLELIERVDVLE